MKLLGWTRLTAHNERAGERSYAGDTSDSASMNIWLHKDIMQKVTETGGKVPADLH